MINQVTAKLLPTATSNDKSRRAPSSEQRSVPQPGSDSFAASIMNDGGLGFLQSRLEDKLNAVFEKAAEKNPDVNQGSAADFFTTDNKTSPEATADRIVSFALNLQGTFARQNPELGADELSRRFESVIREGIESGFGHAREVLGEMKMLEGDVQSNVETTWDLVQGRLAELFGPND